MLEQVAQTLSSDSFVKSAEELNQLLSQVGNDATWYCSSFNPFPLVLSQSEYDTHATIQQALCSAIEAVVGNYLKDARLHQMIPLSHDALELIEALDRTPYLIGSYRPDFLHDHNGGIKVCEINARFPCNGYFITHYLYRAFGRRKSIPPDLHQIDGLQDVPSKFMQRFQRDDRIAIVKGREKGWDVRFFLHELCEAGFACDLISPADLTADNAHDALMLELHQDELLEPNLRATLKPKLGIQRLLNDLRTILLAHDKRFLALLHASEIIKDYVDSKTKDFLQEHVVPTYIIGRSPEKAEEALRNPDQWVLKPNLLGKGEGMLIGTHTPRDIWKTSLRNPDNSEFVLQRFIEQRKFSIRMLVEKNVETVNLNVVGTLLCFDDTFLGTGIYRASQKDIVNVAGGGAILFPMLSELSKP